MACQNCKSERMAHVSGKCSDCFSYSVKNVGAEAEGNGYVPNDLGIGGGDYIEFSYCLSCGQIKGKFPLPELEIEKNISDDDVAEFYSNYFVEGEKLNCFSSHFKRQIIRDANELSPKFGKFIDSFLNDNCDIYSKEVCPNLVKFRLMFRSNTTSLGDLW